MRVSFTVLVPPMNVGVAPSTGPLVPCCTVRLCASGELLVKLIVTVPAFAVSVLLVNFNAPDGSAATEIVLLAALGAPEDAAVEVAGALDAVDVLAAVLLAALAGVLLLLLLEPPHALRPSAIAATASVRLDVFLTSHISLLLNRLND